MGLRTAGALFILAITCIASLDSQVTPASSWLGLGSGQYAVGFKVDYLLDTDRQSVTGEAEGGRPIRLMTWYPTTAGSGTAMTFADYIESQPGNPRFDAYYSLLRARDEDTARRQFSPLSDSLYQWLRALPVAARRDAEVAPGRHPLILHSLGRNNFQQESTALWEFLASHGYVVGVVPQMGETRPTANMAFDASALAIQKADVQFALRALQDWTAVDGTKVGIIGHSSGAMVAALVAAESPTVKAIAGLDGSFVTNDGRALFAAMQWDANAIDIPVLNLYSVGMRRDLSVLDDWTASDRYHMGLGGLDAGTLATHFDFQNWPLYSAMTGIEDDRGTSWRSIELGRAFFEAVCQATLHFFNSVFRDDPEATRVLEGTQPLVGIDAHLVTATVLHGSH